MRIKVGKPSHFEQALFWVPVFKIDVECFLLEASTSLDRWLWLHNWCTTAPVVASIILIVALWLAVIGSGIVVAVVVIEVQGVWTCWVVVDVHVAVPVVVAVWLVEDSAAQPPWRTIRGPPSSLLWGSRHHGILLASTTSILGTSNVDDEVRGTQCRSRGEESLPVSTAGRRKDLHAIWATVLLRGLPNSKTLLARHQNTCKVLARELDPGALARLWTSRLWLQTDTDWLAVVRLGVIVAVAIIERHVVLVAGLAVPQIQKAICRVVTVWLVVGPAAKPPRRSIGCHPCLLVPVLRIHGITSATTTATGRSCDVDDPVWCSHRISRGKESLPITAGSW